MTTTDPKLIERIARAIHEARSDVPWEASSAQDVAFRDARAALSVEGGVIERMRDDSRDIEIDFRDLPEVPSYATMMVLSRSGFPFFWGIGKSEQQRLWKTPELGVVPAKTECEIGMGRWKFIRDALRSASEQSAKASGPDTEDDRGFPDLDNPSALIQAMAEAIKDESRRGTYPIVVAPLRALNIFQARLYAHAVAPIVAAAINEAAQKWQDIANTGWIDGRDVVLFAHGMEVSARYCPGEWSDDTPISPREYSGAVWSCFDDQFQFEIEETSSNPAEWHHGPVTHWREPTPAIEAHKESRHG